ncbi:hypothetical protein B0H14DRAFT_2593923 [Mycena olivaceomarginata]|nr:hypothetical protein B0H14DRAFT_2593923 [Mycena olivaceomarginata]
MPMYINPHTGRYSFSHYSQRHTRYAPYTTSRPSAVSTRQRDNELRTHDPSPAILQLCSDEIAVAKQAGKILTWHEDATGLTGLTEWYRPVETCKQGSVRRLAASRFQFAPGIVMPRCPHAANGFRTIEETSQACTKISNRWVFRSPFHDCEFTTEIPPITSSQVILTAEELTDYLNTPDYIGEPIYVLYGDAQDTDNEDFDQDAVVSTSDWREEERVATYLNSSSPSSSLSSVGASMASPAPLPPSSSLAGSSSSSPIRPTPKQKGTAVRPYFSPISSAKHKSPNYELIATVLELDDSGFYQKHPEEYPAYNAMERPPVVLLPYHPATSGARLADNMQNMTLPYGRVICYYMSTVGISRDALFNLCCQSLLCAGCACWYSIEGYHSHRVLGPTGYVCTGSEDLPMIPSRHPELQNIPQLHFRSYSVLPKMETGSRMCLTPT